MSELPAGWVWRETREIAQVKSGIQKQPKRTPKENAHPFLRVANVGRSRLDLREVHRIELFEDELDRYRLHEGDLLVVEGNGSPDQIGRAALWTGAIPDCVHQNHLIRVRPGGQVDPRYLAHYWNAPQTVDHLRSIASSTSGLHVLTTRKVGSVRVPIPPLPQQERIVAAIEEGFSRIDAGVAALDRVRRNLQRLRDYAFSEIAASVDAWVPLGEIAEVVGGVTKDAKRQTDPEFVERPYLRVANVQRGYLDLAQITTIRVPAAVADKLRLQTNDILFNEGGDRDKLGRGWIWEGQIEKCIHQNHVFRARLTSECFDPRFVSMHGNTYGRGWFEEKGKQTTNLASLNLTTLKSFPIPDLPLHRQREVVSGIEERNATVRRLEQALVQSEARCDRLRSAILTAAFSGQLVPQDPNDEPTSILRERVAAEGASPDGHNPNRTRAPTDNPRKPRTKAMA